MFPDDSPLTPCPICGTPGEVCTGTASPPDHIIGAEIFPSLSHENVFLVEEDVYEDRQIVGETVNEDGVQIIAPKVQRVRIAQAGDALKMSEARRLGLLSS